MSLRKQNTTIPQTQRTLTLNEDLYKITESIFVTPIGFTFTEEEFEDIDFWYSNLGTNIFPLHGITNFEPDNLPEVYTDSIQDFQYKTYKGKQRQNLRYNWSIDYHNLVNDISGQKVNIIYVSGNRLRATQPSAGIVKGFETSFLDLKSMEFTNPSSQGNSVLHIELSDIDEMNAQGYEVEVDWEPKDIDRLLLNITLNMVPDQISMYITYNSQTITGINASDITITDQLNGDITFTTFVPGDGIYILSGFSDTITTACLYIQNTIYIGSRKFNFQAEVIVVNYVVTQDGDYMLTQDGYNMALAMN